MTLRTEKDYIGMKPRISGYLRGIKAETSSNRITLSDSDFVYNSITFRHGTSDSNEITVGAAIIGSCDFSLWNDSGKFDNWDWVNSAIEISLIFNDETVYMGSYVIVSHTESGNIIKVEALDWMKVLDEHTLGECGVTWPIDAVALINRIVTTGVQNMKVSGLDGLEGISLADPGDNEMTNRDALSYAAQCLGRYAVMRTDEKLGTATIYFEWYDSAASYNAGTTFNHQLRTDNVTVTGVIVTASDDETTEERGGAGYRLNIADNPFISPDNISTIADRINASVSGLVFRPGNFALSSNPRIEAGDVITINTDKGTISTLATNVVYKPSQVKESVTADAAAADSDLQIKNKAYINKVIRDQLNNPNSDLGSAVGGGSSISKVGVTKKSASIANASGTVKVEGELRYISKTDSEGVTIGIITGQIKIKPRTTKLKVSDNVVVELSGVPNLPNQYYQTGAVFAINGNMGVTSKNREDGIGVMCNGGTSIEIWLADISGSAGFDNDQTLYIPINLYI